MFDVNFYMKTYPLYTRLRNGEKISKSQVRDAFEVARDPNPYIYNIETTNACNMRCEMCPRTTMMTRDIETMKPDLFQRVVDQIEPVTPELWSEWEAFARNEYGVLPNEMSENHFFLYIIPRVIQLHGYGDPLLDRNIAQCVKALHDKGIPTYFSCNPANINVEETLKIFENGLSYIKYSIESVDEQTHKKVRGEASSFGESYKRIQSLLELKKKNNLNTVIIITMLDLNRENQQDEYAALKEVFKDKDVYIYLKSEDTQWYRKDYHGTNSIHWSEFCRHPWMSMTVKSNGEVAMCMEDFNNEIVLGSTREETLYDIWNGTRYGKFREDHINKIPGMRCSERCDMSLVGGFFSS